MGLLSKVTEFVTGGLFGEIKDTVMSYYPPDMSPIEKANVELKLQQMLNDKSREAERIINEATVNLDNRIKEQEGTASDLKAIPIVGNIILFLRGSQRPVWGYATIYMDYKWFFGIGNEFTEQQQTAMIVINFLVLGFLFGERTLKNLEPLIIKVFGKNTQK